MYSSAADAFAAGAGIPSPNITGERVDPATASLPKDNVQQPAHPKEEATAEEEDPEADAAGSKKDSDGGASERGSLFCTGQLGDVMKESTLIAYTVAKNTLQRLQDEFAYLTHTMNAAAGTSKAAATLAAGHLPVPDFNFFGKHIIHLHVPEGATPKDGPSAGIALVCSLLSLALQRPLVADIAMTGELTLTGKV